MKKNLDIVIKVTTIRVYPFTDPETEDGVDARVKAVLNGEYGYAPEGDEKLELVEVRRYEE